MSPAKEALRETTVISVISVMLLYAPFFLMETKGSAYKRKRMKRIAAASCVLYPVNIALSIPIEIVWLASYPIRATKRYFYIKNFYKALKSSNYR